MLLKPDEKRSLLKLARRNRLSGWDVGCLVLINYFHHKNSGKPLFTEKQLKVFNEIYSSPGSDEQEREVYFGLAHELPVSIGNLMNEAKAHTFLLENYFNQAIASLLAHTCNDPNKSLLPDLHSISITLRDQVPSIWGSLLAYDRLLQRLMRILGFQYKEPGELLIMVKEIANKFKIFLTHAYQQHPKLRRSLQKIEAPILLETNVRMDVLEMLYHRIQLPPAPHQPEGMPWWQLPPCRLPLPKPPKKIGLPIQPETGSPSCQVEEMNPDSPPTNS